MKSFRKTLQESRLKTHHLIRSWLQPKLGAVGTKYRLAGRIRLANIWARKHPRRTFAYVTGSLVFLLASTVLIDGIGQQNNREPDVSSIAQLEPIFAGFRTIQANKSVHRTTLTELTHEGQLLREELDSLIAIPRNPTSTFPPQNFPVIQHLQFLHIYCGYYKFSNSTELG